MNNVIIVWKDGTYKEVDKNSAREFENDKNWLVTIPSEQQKEEKDKEIERLKGLITDNYYRMWKGFETIMKHWIKEANQLGKCDTTHEGFRIYVTKPVEVIERIEEREDGVYWITKFIPGEYIAIDNTGLKLIAIGKGEIWWQIDKEIINRRFS